MKFIAVVFLTLLSSQQSLGQSAGTAPSSGTAGGVTTNPSAGSTVGVPPNPPVGTTGGATNTTSSGTASGVTSPSSATGATNATVGMLSPECQTKSQNLTQTALSCMQRESKNTTLTTYDLPGSLETSPEALKTPFAKCYCNPNNWNAFQGLLAPCQISQSDISQVQTTFQATCGFLKVPFDVKTGPKSSAEFSKSQAPLFAIILTLSFFLLQ
jgi:hypothetical protein